jgi:hypothetical protein
LNIASDFAIQGRAPWGGVIGAAHAAKLFAQNFSQTIGCLTTLGLKFIL